MALALAISCVRLMDMTTYTIKNSNGITGGAWSRTYDTLDAASAAVAAALGWDDAVIGPKMTDSIGDDDEEEAAWCVYPSQEECDADEDGAHAPRIVAQ